MELQYWTRYWTLGPTTVANRVLEFWGLCFAVLGFLCCFHSRIIIKIAVFGGMQFCYGVAIVVIIIPILKPFSIITGIIIIITTTTTTTTTTTITVIYYYHYYYRHHHY